MNEISKSEAYAAAGVDVTAGYESVERIKPMVESTYIPGVLGTLGGFGGMFAPDLTGMKEPVLVESIQADAGLDIGCTMIGMHLREVAVPLRLSVKKVGEAAVNAARTRPKLIGGARAVYPEKV